MLGPTWKRWMWQSPLLVRELRQAARTGRMIVLVLILAALLGLFVLTMAGAFGMGKSPILLGPVLFQVFFSLAYFAVIVLGPALAAAGVAKENDGRTRDALLLAGMTPGALARGKFWTAVTVVMVFLVMIAPASLLCLLLGGVTVIELVIAFTLLAIIAVIGVAFGVAVGAWSETGASATLTALATSLLASPALYFGAGLFTSFLAHATWPEVSSGLPVWLPLAYTRARFDGLYVLLLIVMPLVLTGMALWFFYEIAVALLATPSDDRSTGLKRWYLVCLPVVMLLAAIPGAMTRGTGSTTAWLAGLAALFAFVTFVTFVLAGDALSSSARVEFEFRRDGAGRFRRLLGPGLVQTIILTLVTSLAGLALFSLAGALFLSRGASASVPPAPAVSLLLCAEYGSAFLVFVAGFLTWSRVRSDSVGGARLVTAMVAVIAMAAPWALYLAFMLPATRRGIDAMLLAAPSPLYSLAMVRAVEKGDPHLAVATGIACSLGWTALGLTLFAFGSRIATRMISAQRTREAQLDVRIDIERRADAPFPPLSHAE